MMIKEKWLDLTAQAVVLCLFLVLVAFGFWQYIVVIILYDVWCRICDIRHLFRGMKDHLTMDTDDVAREIAEWVAHSRAGRSGSVDSHRGG